MNKFCEKVKRELTRMNRETNPEQDPEIFELYDLIQFIYMLDYNSDIDISTENYIEMLKSGEVIFTWVYAYGTEECELKFTFIANDINIKYPRKTLVMLDNIEEIY